jgi:hypothetical protein
VTVLSAIAASQLVIAPTPRAHFGIGAIGRLPVLANTPRRPTADDIQAILLAARQLSCRRRPGCCYCR